ncbi:hypothetical protein [Pseudomonas sp. RIT-PI-S]|uniref:hypothetical protein n=1 Tax=Pseudomonas sp. RIT-PI-S TaxID=3035295 RepID=UPI0021DA5DBB|nr:hypothetical protein [Pseudomonas sp. RIT-PI-S]
MRTRAALALVVGYPLLSGCVQGPPLQYTAFSDGGNGSQEDYSGLTKFTLARSLLLVQASKGQPATVAAVPAEAIGSGTDFGIRQLQGTSHLALQLTKIGNSNLVRSLALRSAANPSVPAADSVEQVTASGPANLGNLALAIDVQALLDTPRPGRVPLAGLAQSANSEFAFDIVFDPVPADAIQTRQLDLQRTGNLYFYSACRTATLTFLNAPLAQQRFTVTVADPNFVQTVAIGADRTIASHSSCGVDVLAGAMASGDPGLARQVDQARNLSASWTTRSMVDAASALAALKPSEPVKRPRRKPRPAAVEPAPAQAQAQAEASPAQVPAEGPLRNAQIRVPGPPPRESFAF